MTLSHQRKDLDILISEERFERLSGLKETTFIARVLVGFFLLKDGFKIKILWRKN